MKTKIINLLGAVLSLLITFGLTQNAAAQSTARITFSAPVTLKTKQSTSTTYQISSMNGDGSGITQLTRWGGFWPSWSPDQKFIAFHRSTTAESTIYVMDAAKGEIKGGRTFAVVQASGSGHDWSPDGTTILFTGTSDIGYGLWMVQVNAATGAVGTPVLLGTGACFAPKFSPDTTKVAYYRGGTVRVLDLTTQAEITLPQSNTGPSWSPDGTKIAFGGVVCYGSTANCHLEIVIANADGTGSTPVTALQSYSSFPTWSPDGMQLAFYSQVSGSKAMYKTTIGTGTVTLLYNGAELGADWAP
jgi:Tol biopolymer transport system component